MPSRASTSLLLPLNRVMKAKERMCQCPHGLVPHCYGATGRVYYVVFSVSMPSRASTSLLQYPFKNLGFMRFPEPVFAGICQNILTVTHFHAC